MLAYLVVVALVKISVIVVIGKSCLGSDRSFSESVEPLLFQQDRLFLVGREPYLLFCIELRLRLELNYLPVLPLCELFSTASWVRRRYGCSSKNPQRNFFDDLGATLNRNPSTGIDDLLPLIVSSVLIVCTLIVSTLKKSTAKSLMPLLLVLLKLIGMLVLDIEYDT